MSTIIPSPCPVWCSGDHRPAGTHRAEFAELQLGPDDVVDVAIVDYAHPSLPGPKVSVDRHTADETIVVDLTPGQADALAGIVMALSSWSTRQDFANALARAAGTLMREEGSISARGAFWGAYLAAVLAVVVTTVWWLS